MCVVAVEKGLNLCRIVGPLDLSMPLGSFLASAIRTASPHPSSRKEGNP